MTEDVGRTAAPTWAGGRRARLAGGRHHRMKIRCSDAELAELHRRATVAGVSPQRYLLDAVEATPVTVSERRRRVVEFGALHRQLARLAAHVDQLAQEADATGRLPAGTAETLVAVERLAGPLAQATERLTAAFEKPPGGR